MALPDRERAFVGEWRDLSDAYGRLGEDEGALVRMFSDRDPLDRGELLTPDQAAPIMRARRRRERTRTIADLRAAVSAVDTPGTALDPATIPDLASRVASAVGSDTLTVPLKRRAIVGLAHAIDAAGIDATALHDVARALQHREVDALDAARAVDSWRPSTPHGRPSLTRVAEAVNRAADTLATAPPVPVPAPVAASLARLRQMLAEGQHGPAATLLADLSRRRSTPLLTDLLGVDLPAATTTLRAAHQRAEWLARTAKFTPARVDQLSRNADRVHARAVPPRFQPAVNTAITDRVAALYSEHPNFDAIAHHVAARDFRALDALSDIDSPTLGRDLRV